jgi:signal transduction histidine kinase
VTRGVRRSDVVLTGAFLGISIVQLSVDPIESLWVGGSAWFGVVLAVVSLLPLAWRRVHPVAAAVVGSSLWWVPTNGFLVVGYVCAVLLFFAVGRWVQSRKHALAACAWAIATGTAGFVATEYATDRLIYLVLDVELGDQVAEAPVPGTEALIGIAGFWAVVLFPYAVGRLLARQQRDAEEQIRTERESARRLAAEEERARIVRELHDVVGHEVTLMSIQSEAAAQALEHAPDRAAGPIIAVRETAHRAHRELRAILDLLGEGELAVAADERGLVELTDRAARLGIANTLTMSGTPWTDAPRHWLAVNRIVQECLTNAGKHAHMELVEATVDWSDDGVRVAVANRSPAEPRPGTGRGVPGMAERARLLGGTLETAYANGRFEVTAWLPGPGDASR